MDRLFSEVKKVEEGVLEYYETGVEYLDINVYRDKVDFFDYDIDGKEPDWTCTFEEYKRFLIGKKAFLMLPKEPESYLEIKINEMILKNL